LRDVDVGLTITHTFASDLDITLTSPAGTVVTLSTDNGGSNDQTFNGVVFDDDAGDVTPPGGMNDTAALQPDIVRTPIAPEEGLASLIGEDPNGTWTLTVTDDAGGDTGTLHRWDLRLRSCATAPSTQQATASNNASTPIPSPGIAKSRVQVSGACSYVQDVNASTNIAHDESFELQVILSSPGGSDVTLTTDQFGGTNVFAGTTWDDSAGDSNPPGPVNDVAYVDGTPESPVAPEEPFGAFIGEDPNGIWTLTARDTDIFASTQPGSIEGWSLDLRTICGPRDAAGPQGPPGASGPPGPAGPAGPAGTRCSDPPVT
jgi:subtilisin-like proprotein convertase family protein